MSDNRSSRVMSDNRSSRVMSDNRSCYRSHAHTDAGRQFALKHLRAQPYGARTNGRIECLIHTILPKSGCTAPWAADDQQPA
jgi:hypothetical protein